MADPSSGPRYEVHCSGAVREHLHALQRQATREGRGQEMLAAFRHIVARLEEDALEVGEPLFRLPVIRTQVRSVVVRPLAINFAVCEDRPVVFIKGGDLLSPAGS